MTADATKRDELPAGWYEGMDKTYGRPYYFNRHTRRSTWTRPSALRANDTTHHMHDGAKAGTKLGLRSDEKLDPEPDRAAISEGYYKKRNRAPLGITKNAVEELNGNHTVVAPRDINKYWMEVYSAKHRRVYYFNKLTRESVWINPIKRERVAATKEQMNTTSNEAVQNAWRELEDARRQLQEERRAHRAKMQKDWDEMQKSMSKMRAKAHTLTVDDEQWATDYADGKLADANESSTAPAVLPLPRVRDNSVASDNAKIKPKRRRSSLSRPRLSMRTATPVSGVRRRSTSRGSQARVRSMKKESLTEELDKFARDLKRRSSVVAAKSGGLSTDRRRRRSVAAAEEASQIHNVVRGILESNNLPTFEEASTVGMWMGGMGAPSGPKDVDAALDDVVAGLNAVKAEVKAQQEALSEAAFADEEGGYYRALGVETNVSQAKLKKAHRKMMIKWHPDKHRNDADGGKKATEMSGLVQTAFEVLSDPWERSIYDWFGLEQYLLHLKVIQCFKNYMWTGIDIIKHPRKGRPRKRMMWLSPDADRINTAKVRIMEITTPGQKDAIKGVEVNDIVDIVDGIATDNLKRTGKRARADRYFSIITAERTLDIEAPSAEMKEFLMTRITLLVIDLKKDMEWMERYYDDEDEGRECSFSGAVISCG